MDLSVLGNREREIYEKVELYLKKNKGDKISDALEAITGKRSGAQYYKARAKLGIVGPRGLAPNRTDKAKRKPRNNK